MRENNKVIKEFLSISFPIVINVSAGIAGVTVLFWLYGVNDFKTIQAVSFLIFIGSIVVYNRFYLKYVRNSKVE